MDLIVQKSDTFFIYMRLSNPLHYSSPFNSSDGWFDFVETSLFYYIFSDVCVYLFFFLTTIVLQWLNKPWRWCCPRLSQRMSTQTRAMNNQDKTTLIVWSFDGQITTHWNGFLSSLFPARAVHIDLIIQKSCRRNHGWGLAAAMAAPRKRRSYKCYKNTPRKI